MPLIIVREDITRMQVDAIVNTTNAQMIGYSGVDRAIHTVAGEELAKECASLVPLGVGRAVMTRGYRLPARYVIHTVGPVYRDGLQGESILLRSCYLECLTLATERGIRTIAFPLISSGAYGYPKDQVLKFAVKTITEYLDKNELTVYLCVFDKTAYTFSKQLFDDIQSFLQKEPPTDACIQDAFRRRKPSSDCAMLDADMDEDAPVCRSMEGPSSFLHEETNFFRARRLRESRPSTPDSTGPTPSSVQGKTLYEYVRQKDKSFAEMLFALIDERGMSDVECYKRANVDKRIFSKIRSNPSYRPSKPTAIAFAISLKLDLETTQALLATAGYTLSRSFDFDKIIRYFIQNERYDIFEINEALFEFDLTPLGAI